MPNPNRVAAGKKGGAQPGNTNAKKNKPWRDAIDRAIAQANLGQKRGYDVLRIIAATMLKEAKKGEPWAVRELGDRLDGKSVQPLSGFDGGDIIVQLAKGDEKA